MLPATLFPSSSPVFGFSFPALRFLLARGANPLRSYLVLYSNAGIQCHLLGKKHRIHKTDVPDQQFKRPCFCGLKGRVERTVSEADTPWTLVTATLCPGQTGPEELLTASLCSKFMIALSVCLLRSEEAVRTRD